MTISLDAIRNEAIRRNARWTPKQNPLLALTPAQRQRRLGVIVDLKRRAAAMSRVGAPIGAAAPHIDWRNVNGKNHVTLVKDQGNCGSCVSFGTVGTTESMASIQHGVTLDLSEADLHFCSSHGPNCEGWWPDDALQQLNAHGVVPEDKFPYNTAFDGNGPHCHAISDHDRYAVKLGEYHSLASVAERKAWLSNVGPVAGVFEVFEDFFTYGSGVYHHITGSSQGHHCVEIIGYDDAERCWIAKNSWDTSWGDSGFFKIGYGECGIESDAFYGERGIALPAAVTSAPLTITVHLQDIGDRTYHADEFAGTRGQSRRLEGFAIRIQPAVPGLTMQYMAHLQDIGDTPWCKEGDFVGTRGQSRRLEGFAIKLAGPNASHYTVSYMAHLQNIGDTSFLSDGEFCGTRGQSRRVEGICVRVNRR